MRKDEQGGMTADEGRSARMPKRFRNTAPVVFVRVAEVVDLAPLDLFASAT